MKITAASGDLDLSPDTIPRRFVGGPCSIALQNLGVSDPTILVFPGNYENKSNNAVNYSGLGAEVTGYVRLSGFIHGVVPDLTNLHREDGVPLNSTDFEAITESLVADGFIAFATQVIGITRDLDDEDVWPVPPEDIVAWV